jgi:hypothetical protein
MSTLKAEATSVLIVDILSVAVDFSCYDRLSKRQTLNIQHSRLREALRRAGNKTILKEFFLSYNFIFIPPFTTNPSTGA